MTGYNLTTIQVAATPPVVASSRPAIPSELLAPGSDLLAPFRSAPDHGISEIGTRARVYRSRKSGRMPLVLRATGLGIMGGEDA